MATFRTPVKAVVFDFDGTISTLREGWEGVMKTIMERFLAGPEGVTPALETEIHDYIEKSAGIQTILQMDWLAAEVHRRGKTDLPTDPWYYKKEYNDLLMETVGQRRANLNAGKSKRWDYLMAGSVQFLQALKLRGIKMYLASGTDSADVKAEAAALGVADYFESIAGAEPGSRDCAKEAAIKKLIGISGFKGEDLAIIGDGRVEIALGKENGARTIGMCTDEVNRHGFNELKRKRLESVNADILLGDFTDIHTLLDFLGVDGNPQLDFSGLKTYSAKDRINLVTIESLLKPGISPVPEWDADGFSELVERIITARRAGRPVMLSMGAHVIKNNLSLYLIELMKSGIVTHLSGNGACSIHDFELAYLGGTSEHVPTAIEDGSFGMWEETGRWMNEAIQEGVKEGYGYGESLARYIDAHKERFPHRDACVVYQAWKCGVPATYHIALGTDIIHQHPICDFAAIGKGSERDFHTYCQSLSQLDGGVYMNFGSGVIGPEVFLKALSISRNLGFQTFKITTANFDIKDLGDFRCKVGYDNYDYYYRPRKNIVNRPVSCGGKGWHFVGDHKQTLANLYRALAEKGMIR